MDCSYCKKPVMIAFELTEDVPGEGPSKRRACFLCVQAQGEKFMAEKRKQWGDHHCVDVQCAHESHR